MCEGTLSGNDTIDVPIGLAPGSKILRSCGSGERAVTHWRAVTASEDHTLLSLKLDTGRTHQIRAHLAAIGHPIVGDTLYGASPAERIMLHCERLTFTHPYTGEQVVVTSPADFNR